MFKIDELDINYFATLAESHVGEIHDLKFETMSKRLERAGRFEILEYHPENLKFGYSYWKYAEAETPNRADLGYYLVKITESKFYNGKVIRVPVIAYVQDEKGITKAIFISTLNLDTGKRLKAYDFGILDYNVYD